MHPQKLLKWYRLIALALVASLPASASGADCVSWNVSGRWALNQASGHYVGLDLQQSDGVITGTAVWYEKMPPDWVFIGWVGNDPEEHSGSLDGRVAGDEFNAQIFWNDRVIGVYTGKIGPQGRIEGETYDRDQPNLRTTWFSSIPLTCAEYAKVVIPMAAVPEQSIDRTRAVATSTSNVSTYQRPNSAAAAQQGAPVVSSRPTAQNQHTSPSISASIAYTGQWTTRIGSGMSYQMTLTQEGNRVKGNYTPGNGTIDGSVDGDGTLIFRWTEGRATGAGRFRLSDDGRSFGGSYSNSDDSNAVTNTWQGERL